jgi:hypothetical protein
MNTRYQRSNQNHFFDVFLYIFFSGVRVTRSLVLYVCFVDRCLSFCTFFLLAIVLSVLVRFTDSDYKTNPTNIRHNIQNEDNQEKFEDTEWVIRKYRQCNDQKKKKAYNYLQNTTQKTKDLAR